MNIIFKSVFFLVKGYKYSQKKTMHSIINDEFSAEYLGYIEEIHQIDMICTLKINDLEMRDLPTHDSLYSKVQEKIPNLNKIHYNYRLKIENEQKEGFYER